MRENLDLTRKFIARHNFVANGRKYKPGDSFQWKKACPDKRKLRNLYEAGYIMMEPLEVDTVVTAESEGAEIVLNDAIIPEQPLEPLDLNVEIIDPVEVDQPDIEPQLTEQPEGQIENILFGGLEAIQPEGE